MANYMQHVPEHKGFCQLSECQLATFFRDSQQICQAEFGLQVFGLAVKLLIQPNIQRAGVLDLGVINFHHSFIIWFLDGVKRAWGAMGGLGRHNYILRSKFTAHFFSSGWKG